MRAEARTASAIMNCKTELQIREVVLAAMKRGGLTEDQGAHVMPSIIDSVKKLMDKIEERRKTA